MNDQPVKRPRGRPRLADPSSVRINFRVTPAEREKYREAARQARTTLTLWIKALLDRESS
jgi:uncharacterized protein (DUF1778 family)